MRERETAFVAILFDSRRRIALPIRTSARSAGLLSRKFHVAAARYLRYPAGGCLRAGVLLSNCCPARPLPTEPPIKRSIGGYQEAVDHFHGFAAATARATLIQYALIRTYIYIYIFKVGTRARARRYRDWTDLNARVCSATYARGVARRNA